MPLLHIPINIYPLTIKKCTLQGSVILDGSGIERRVLVYKNDSVILYDETFSDSNGDWELEVVGNHNDKFTCIAVPKDETENAAIASWVTPP